MSNGWIRGYKTEDGSTYIAGHDQLVFIVSKVDIADDEITFSDTTFTDSPTETLLTVKYLSGQEASGISISEDIKTLYREYMKQVR